MFLAVCVNAYSQHTFSIVAVDPATQEVGSAGASFVGGVTSSVISDVHPGVGAIHTQAYYEPLNQDFAKMLMDGGSSPQEIIDYLVAMDVESYNRQYVVVDLVDEGRSAAFTGDACPECRGQILGQTYAIAGNILHSAQVLEKMESSFLNTEGTLADKLMAALQGAKEEGGDKRGDEWGLSSLMAFLRVAQSDNSADSLYIDLLVARNYPAPGQDPPTDPVDDLQTKYDDWKKQATRVSEIQLNVPDDFQISQNYPNPFNPMTTISYQLPEAAHVTLSIYNLKGQLVTELVSGYQNSGIHDVQWNAQSMSSGIYVYQLKAGEFTKVRKCMLLR